MATRLLRTYEQRLIAVTSAAVLPLLGFMFWLEPTWTAILLAVVVAFAGAAVWVGRGEG